MTKVSTMRALAAAIVVGVMQFSNVGAYAASSHAAHVSGTTTSGERTWPRRPCRNWHKVCNPY